MSVKSSWPVCKPAFFIQHQEKLSLAVDILSCVGLAHKAGLDDDFALRNKKLYKYDKGNLAP
jgi:hypothetical protein